MQPVLTQPNTVAHTRSLLQQLIDQGMTRQPTSPQQQVDPTQTTQMVLNELAISGQLNVHQPVPSAGQLIGHIPPVTSPSNTQGSSGAKASTPNPQPRTSEEQPSETPSAEMQAMEQISAELKSHMKQELIDHLSEMMQKQFGIKPKQQTYMYRTPYPSGYDQISFPPRFKVL
jgi:hypothetical protein